ncbi:ribonucleases P/MRP protein subunit POP1-domain-containing protein [Kickxella alabastrina]|uniref:ribonucleases P/MRP protein subunit POP1-domain-containing protein n=1 Tax=Kickxella alabastrina TaxID=61397 RepID=UPI00221F90DC|nr:ribonucleases P/MRP protein subunit POP1-domain-containing protein [Kickxella alabastrina]KAI7821135.1 ribonucleases P/MRP protein subunit POP1-domain-containing protein [Kickxella alabastrina]
MEANRGTKRKAPPLSAAAGPAAHETLAKARSVDVTGFVEARAFEINALQRSLDGARTAGNARAFQTLARHLRRRAASHNVKRVPARLRARAEEEMRKSAAGNDSAKPPKPKPATAHSRYKRRRTRAVRDEYALRQTGARWLETHVWHAKRMRMERAWGTVVAATPNERSHRAAYRAAKERCYAHDASRHSAGAGAAGCARRADPGRPRYADGARLAPLALHRAHMFPRAALGPASALWMPAGAAAPRTLWLRTHPAIADAVRAELGAAAGLAVADVTCDLVSFELLGAASTRLLAAVLAHAHTPSAGAAALRAARCVPAPDALPEGAVLALRIHDPRLGFPPRPDPTGGAGHAGSDHGAPDDEVLRAWPGAGASQLPGGDGGVFDRARCAADVARRQSEHALNQRRRAQLVPGTRLAPGADDVSVPLLLIRTGPEAALGSRVGAFDARFVGAMAHGWTLVAPRGWGMALWMPLIFAGARAQGQCERLHVSLEAGLPAFPRDWPGTAAYDAAAAAAGADALLRWQRRPPGKRANYAHAGIESPFFAPLHRLLGMPAAPAGYPQPGPAGLECRMRRLKKTKPKPAAADPGRAAGPGQAAELDQPAELARPADSADIWLVTGERLAAAWAAPLLAAVRADGADQPDGADALLQRCLVRVRLVCTARGVPANNAPVCLPASAADPIGYVIAGSFSLARGCGMALAACSLRGLFALCRDSPPQAHRTVSIRAMDGGPACEAALTVLPPNEKENSSCGSPAMRVLASQANDDGQAGMNAAAPWFYSRL